MVNEWIVVFKLLDLLTVFEEVLYQKDPILYCVHFGCSINIIIIIYHEQIMRLIAHRGNFNGPNPARENRLDYLKEAIDAGFDVEVDIWEIDGKFFLGHDAPTHQVSWEEIKMLQPYSWFHAKNLQVLTTLLSHRLHVFFHDQDEYTLTSRGFIWAYSGKDIGANGVACMPESTPGFSIPKGVYAVCSDWLTGDVPGAVA